MSDNLEKIKELGVSIGHLLHGHDTQTAVSALTSLLGHLIAFEIHTVGGDLDVMTDLVVEHLREAASDNLASLKDRDNIDGK